MGWVSGDEVPRNQKPKAFDKFRQIYVLNAWAEFTMRATKPPMSPRDAKMFGELQGNGVYR